MTGRVWVPDFPLAVGGTGSPVRRDQWYPACVHVEADECACRCHTAPFLHDKACCDPCARCGFRTAVRG